ncbi:MAG: afsK 10 [Candidatus Eremiobacteraeota bacterium]|nr:afsK 10 [Candidatus Eremiobacteraeota bacterium]
MRFSAGIGRGTLRAVWWSLALAGCASSAPLSTEDSATRAAPAATPTPGEQARPIAVEEGAAFDAGGGATKPRSDVSLAAVKPGRSATVPTNLAVSRGTAYALHGDRVRAIDLASGATRWISGPGFDRNRAPLVGGDLMIVLSEDYKEAVALRTRDGSRAYTLRGVVPAGVIDGILYAQHGRNFAAYELSGGKRLWETPGGGGLSGKPAIVGTMLLQLYYDSGAITVGDLYAFDVRTGHVRWMARSNVEPLGVVGRNVYVDSTWQPMQLENYVPLTVSRIDTASGNGIDTWTYTPDPERHAHPPPGDGPGRATSRRVAGGFVYLLVRGSWYRYAADTEPSKADPVRLDGIDDILAWFGNGALLVVGHGELAVARETGGRIVLHRIAAARGYSKAFARDDGTQYVVDADALYAVARDGNTVRALGGVPCGGDVTDIVSSGTDVAVVCSPRTSTGPDRIVAFSDPVAPVHVRVSRPRPQPAPPARFVSRVQIFSIPPRPSRFSHQWWLHQIAPLPDGGAVFTLDPGTADAPFAIGRANAHGRVDVTPLGTNENLIVPDDVVADRHGTVWFNDAGAPRVGSLARSGRIAWHLPGEARELPAATPTAVPTPSPAAANDRLPMSGPNGGPPMARPRGIGIRLAIGPDGEAWFARTHPARIIGRVDGSASFATPDDVGDILRLRGDRHGFWYAARSGYGHVTTDGRFSRPPLPPLPPEAYDRPVLAPGADGTAWFATGTSIVHANAHAVLMRTKLPNITVGATAAAVGCDGALYVAESVPQIARIAPNGQIDEFPIDVFGIDGITVGSDCRLWFGAGSNAPEQQIGTLELRPRH